MTFTTFIKRPVLSTVISIVIVLLGFIGLASLWYSPVILVPMRKP